ncbi:MAG: hypothetical protein K1X71_14900 [Pirellulales bacterium]|nr:hypothetical protein [Pirellulales bacterium]
MYGFPKDFDGSFFIGKRIELVSFAAYQIWIGFEERISITIESSFVHENSAEPKSAQCPPVESSSLMRLVGRMVTSVAADELGTLSLTFDDGQILRCFDDTENYECYRNTVGDAEYFI